MEAIIYRKAQIMVICIIRGLIHPEYGESLKGAMEKKSSLYPISVILIGEAGFLPRMVFSTWTEVLVFRYPSNLMILKKHPIPCLLLTKEFKWQTLYSPPPLIEAK